MLSNLKSKIKDIAFKAVEAAEEALGSSNGRQKKEMAIEYIVAHIPVISPFKKLIAILLSGFIDDTIEFAVQYMNSKKGEI